MPGKKKEEETAVVAQTSRTMTLNRRQDEVARVSNLEELQNRFQSTLVDWNDIEPTFPVIDKEALEGVPFVLAGFRLNESDKFMTRDEVNPEIMNKGRFVSCLVAAIDENTGEFISPWSIINDGSTGIMKSLVKYVKMATGDEDVDSTKEEFNSAAAGVPPIMCKNGLRASRYPYDDGKQVTEATTWYIG
jgi:hypothetical protein